MARYRSAFAGAQGCKSASTETSRLTQPRSCARRRLPPNGAPRLTKFERELRTPVRIIVKSPAAKIDCEPPINDANKGRAYW